VSSKMRSCKEIAALVVAREDRHLSIGERLELRAHMWICKACPSFERQILTMRNAMRQWRNYSGDVGGAAAPLSATDPSVDKAAK
jgi:Putative zinc-finger